MKKPRITFRVESYVDPCGRATKHQRTIQVTQRDFLIFENDIYSHRIYAKSAEEAQREVERCYAILNEKYSADPENNPLPIVNTTRK